MNVFYPSTSTLGGKKAKGCGPVTSRKFNAFSFVFAFHLNRLDEGKEYKDAIWGRRELLKVSWVWSRDAGRFPTPFPLSTDSVCDLQPVNYAPCITSLVRMSHSP